METVAFLGLLGLGYVASNTFGAKKEGFATSSDAPANVPGKPRKPYDTMFELPAGGSLPAEPNPSKMQATPIHFPVPPTSLPAQHNVMEAAAALQIRPDRWEDATPRAKFVSPLSGVEFRPGEFKHANMVPFAKKFTQSLIDTANVSMLDSYTGSGKDMFAKRETTPFFEPTKEPMGNPFGMESTTEFMEDRVIEGRNRTNERPMESIRVGPGLNAGYTHLPSGGFQQTAGEEYIQARMPRTNDLRVATNPKNTYSAPVVTGSHYIKTSGTAETVGEVRKYAPDRYYLNEHGERNFVTTGADLKPVTRSAQVMKHTTRPETTREYAGAAGQAEGKATYTIASTRTPLVKQMGSWGFRNADLTGNFNPDTDAEQNDYGKSGMEILPNERFYTGERVHATNLVPDKREGELPLQDGARATRAEELIANPRSAGNFTALGAGLAEKPTLYDPNDPLRTTIKETTIDNDWIGMAAPVEAQPKLTVYDPNDVARTTIRETTEDNDWMGIAAPADAAQKLTVYDPDDIARVTGRNTLADWDTYRNLGRQDTPEGAEVRIQDGVRLTQKAAISAKSAYTGTAATANAKAEVNRTSAQAMRHYAQRENVARGRTPMGSSVKLFNGEDNVNMQYRRIVADSVNDREPGMDRVATEPTSSDVIGVQRPRAVLKLDISATRAEPLMVSSLEKNPYVIPLHRVAAM